MDSEIVRAFFAIKLPPKSLEYVDKELSGLKKSIPDRIKWVSVGSMHITLKFVGAFRIKHLPSIQKDLITLLKGFGNINFSIGMPGVFPDIRNPKILWLGLENTKRIQDLVKIIDQLMMRYGYEKEKRIFSPHLTIGRLKNTVSLEEKILIGQQVASYTIPLTDPVVIDRTFLIKSDLTPRGAIYTTLFEINL